MVEFNVQIADKIARNRFKSSIAINLLTFNICKANGREMCSTLFCRKKAHSEKANHLNRTINIINMNWKLSFVGKVCNQRAPVVLSCGKLDEFSWEHFDRIDGSFFCSCVSARYIHEL